MNYIYKITNILNSKIYIGSTINFQKRRWEHLCHLRNNKHHSPIMQNSFNKYGEKVFKFEIIEEIKEIEGIKMLLKHEQYWINKLQPKFNCSSTAGSPFGTKHTSKSKKKYERSTQR